MCRDERVHHVTGAGDFRRELIRGALLRARNRLRDAHEELAVPEKRFVQHGRLASDQILDRPPDCLTRFVDPWTERRIAAMIVAEFMRDDRAELRHRYA